MMIGVEATLKQSRVIRAVMEAGCDAQGKQPITAGERTPDDFSFGLHDPIVGSWL